MHTEILDVVQRRTPAEGVHIVRLIRGLAAALIGVAAVVGLAVPAQAQGNVKAPGVPEGVYTVNIDGQADDHVGDLPDLRSDRRRPA